MTRDKKADRKNWHLHRDLVPVTLDQLNLAFKIAQAAATGAMPRQSFSSKFAEAREAGKLQERKYLVLTDAPENHAAMAIMDTFPEKTLDGERLRQSLLYRVMFVASNVFADPRAQKYFKSNSEGEWVGYPLLEALGTTPMRMGDEAPLDAIFAAAD